MSALRILVVQSAFVLVILTCSQKWNAGSSVRPRILNLWIPDGWIYDIVNGKT